MTCSGLGAPNPLTLWQGQGQGEATADEPDQEKHQEALQRQFSGREKLLLKAVDLVEQVWSRGGMMFVEGGPGEGKTLFMVKLTSFGVFNPKSSFIVPRVDFVFRVSWKTFYPKGSVELFVYTCSTSICTLYCYIHYIISDNWCTCHRQGCRFNSVHTSITVTHCIRAATCPSGLL